MSWQHHCYNHGGFTEWWSFKFCYCNWEAFCFGVDGVSTFQGIKIGVIKNKHKLCTFFHWGSFVVHKCNLAFKTLFTLGIISSIENLLQNCHAYFAHSPKRHLKFIKLIDMMETKGFKMFKNVKTRWIFLLDPLRRILLKYKPLLAKMFMDSNNNQVVRITSTLNYYMFLALYVICYNVFCIF
jgi:hypothetical protein